MKHIVKSKEPQALLDFKSEFKRKHKRDAIYENISAGAKKSLKASLFFEQYYLCCYCMKRIKPGNSHIEHIKPQSRNPTLTLDYSNMLVSCNGIEDRNEHCGHNKDGWYDENDFVSPLDKDCEETFSYCVSGQIGSSKKNGKTTIDRLNLNSLLLIRARKALIELSGLFEEDFDQRKRDILEYYTVPNSDNELPPFCIAIVYCISNY